MAYTRVQFRDLVRQRLGWSAVDTFVTDAELNNYLNDSLVELHSLLVTAYRTGQWGVALADTTVLAGTAEAPIDFFDFGRLIKVTLFHNNSDIPLEPGDWTIDAQSRDPEVYTPYNVRYYLSIDGVNSKIMFDRFAGSNTTITVHYVRSPPVLSGEGQSSWMGWDEYVTLDCCIKCETKEEGDVSAFTRQKDILQQRIIAQATPLDMGRGATVQDARSDGLDRYDDDRGWWRRWG